MTRALDLLDLQLAVVRDEYERLTEAGAHTAAEVEQLVGAMDGLTEAWTALVSELATAAAAPPEARRERRDLEALLRRLAVLRSKAIALHLSADRTG